MSVDVKRILREIKVDDNHILLEKPITYNKYGIDITINQVNFYYKWDNVAKYIGLFFSVYNSVCKVLKLPESLDDLKTFQDNIRMTLKNTKVGKLAFKQLLKLCKFFGVKRSWAKRCWSLDDWTEFFIYVYIYNIAGQKKSLKIALDLLQKVQ
jgi:hypothetical protein